MSSSVEGPRIPQDFSVVYSPTDLYKFSQEARKIQEENKGAINKPHRLSGRILGGLFLDAERTKLYVSGVHTTIQSDLFIGTFKDSPPHGYFSEDKVKKLQASLRARNVDSDIEKDKKGKTVLYLPRKGEFVYTEIHMGYSSENDLKTYLGNSEFRAVPLSKEEKEQRVEICKGNVVKNKKISVRLCVENEWMDNPHFGPRIFDFYFSKYEPLIRSLCEVEGFPLPINPILIKPIPLRTED